MVSTSQHYIVFNHFYRLRHDCTRSYILSPEISNNISPTFVDTNCILRIHPIYAMIFSFFSSPIELGKAIAEIANFLDIPSEQAEKLVIPFTPPKKIFPEGAR